MKCTRCRDGVAADGRKKCQRCLDNSRGYQHKWRRINPDANKSSAAIYRAKNLAKVREADNWYCKRKRYGIGKEEYELLVESHGGLCAICRKVCSSGRALAIDHCHVTKKIRGLLCSNCNTAIGKFQDDPALLALAIEYLRRNA